MMLEFVKKNWLSILFILGLIIYIITIQISHNSDLKDLERRLNANFSNKTINIVDSLNSINEQKYRDTLEKRIKELTVKDDVNKKKSQKIENNIRTIDLTVGKLQKF